MVKRKKDDEDKEDTEKTTGYQDMNRTVNVIFGGESGFATKWTQKLVLQEIMSIEPVVPRPLRWSENPITFDRNEQWTSFSELEKFPLVLDPVVACV